jgi:UDP-N-acetylglucosamine 4,6-dehydratase
MSAPTTSILITGATGTFGRAFLRNCLESGMWRRVIAFSRDEVKQAQLMDEFSEYPALRMFLGDVRDSQRLGMALNDVDVVVHAAALKRVDAGAYSPSEMIVTNILGTMNVVNAAINAAVKRVVVISSDKSVGATNIYGSTKFCAESYAVQANAYGHARGTRITAVRYGNVLGSRGSVLHIWRNQVKADKPLTLTHPDMTRFVMTIEQAMDLVWYALRETAGGEVVVPLLPAAKMITLARAVAGDAYPIETTGLRPGGEKMAEALLNEEEPSRTFRHDNYLIVTPSHHEWTNGAHWEDLASERWLPTGLTYRSDTVPRWCETAELRALLAESQACQV